MSAADANGTRRNSRWGLATALACTTCLTVAPSAAIANPGLGITAALPGTAAVGDTGVPGSLTITNLNTAPETIATLCNAGDVAPCPVGGNGITLVPSCSGLDAALACNVANTGIFDVSPTATGAVGTECAGVTFTVAPVAGDAFGAVSFTPQGPNVQLADNGSVCRIDFTVDVKNVPVDADPTVAGEQTFMVADASQRSDRGKMGFAHGTAAVTVLKSPPPPPPTPPSPPPAPPAPPSPPAAGSQAPAVSGSAVGPGSAKISGKTGCATKNFNVTVAGRQIHRVVFSLDRKRVKTLTKPNSGRTFTFRVLPGRLKRGTHRITAQTTFTAASGTRARTLRVVFQRCARGAASPSFTG